MAEDRTPKVVSLTQPADEIPRMRHRREGVEKAQGRQQLGPEEDWDEGNRAPKSGRGSDDIHPPSIV